MKRFIRALAVLTAVILCLTQCGCSIVLLEGTYLKNPTEATTATTTASTNDEATASTSGGTGVSGGQTTASTKATQAVIKNKEPKLSGKLEIQINTNESEAQENAWTELIDLYEKKTGVNVTAYIGSQVNTQLTKRWIGGNPPDIACLSGSGIPDVALEESGALYDCTDLLKTGYVYGTDDKIWDVVDQNLHEISDGGKLYRPGYLASCYGVLYDRNYLNRLGVKAPQNYTELKSFADTLIKRNIAVFTTYGSTGGYSTWSMIMPAISAYGQTLLDNVLQVKASAWKSAEVKSVFQRWVEISTTPGLLMTGTATFDHTTAQMKWLNHDAVLIGNGIWLPWEMKSYTPSSFDMHYMHSPMILDSQEPSVVLYPTSMIIAKDGKNQENAKAFMRFLYTVEAQTILVKALGYYGGRIDMDCTKISGLSAASRNILTYLYSDEVNRYYRRYSWGDLNDTINASVAGMMTGIYTADAAIERVLSRA